MTRKGIALLALCTLIPWVSNGVAATKPIAPAVSGTPAAPSPSPEHPDLVLRLAADSVEILEDTPLSDNTGAPPSGRVIPDTPLSFLMVTGATILAEVRVANLTLRREVSVRDVYTVIRFGETVMRIDPLTIAGARGGSIAASMEVHTVARERYGIASRVRIAGMDANAVLGLLGSRKIVSGAKTDASIDSSGQGTTIRALAGTLSGDVRILLGPGRIATATVDFGDDALVRALDALNPFRETERETRIQCAVLRFPIREGVAVIERGFGVQTDKLNIIGSGVVNLRDETLDLAFHPRVREGLGLNIKATLAQMVRVRGTLANPIVGIDPEGSARTALQIGAAVLSGGTSLVVTSLFDRAVATQPCDAALGKVRPSSTTTTNVITDTMKAPARVFEGIFGK